MFWAGLRAGLVLAQLQFELSIPRFELGQPLAADWFWVFLRPVVGFGHNRKVGVSFEGGHGVDQWSRLDHCELPE